MIKFCSSNKTDICCSGYQLISEVTCVACDIGYNGRHCENRCAAPFYGFDCQFECKCEKEDCHYAVGCKQTYKAATKPSKKTTPMVVGIIVLAAVAFILSLTILFTYQISKRQRSRNSREGNVQSEDLNNVYRETFF
uniref:EGF-like domain-containing protein n=1 Tax=Magallana gigas TaxID=29159 RepID=A0A8W8MC87_MAGGI